MEELGVTNDIRLDGGGSTGSGSANDDDFVELLMLKTAT